MKRPIWLLWYRLHIISGVVSIWFVRGEAIVSTGVQKYIFNEQTELIFLTGSLLQVLEASEDLQVKMLMFPKEAFLNAMLPIDTPYFNYTHEHPCYRHTADERSQKTWRQINLWMDMAQMLFTEPMPQFRGQQEHNFCKVCSCGCLIRFRKSWLSASNIAVLNYSATGLCNWSANIVCMNIR